MRRYEMTHDSEKNVSHFIKAIENSKNVRHDQCSQCTFDRQTVRYTYEYHKHCSG